MTDEEIDHCVNEVLDSQADIDEILSGGKLSVVTGLQMTPGPLTLAIVSKIRESMAKNMDALEAQASQKSGTFMVQRMKRFHAQGMLEFAQMVQLLGLLAKG